LTPPRIRVKFPRLEKEHAIVAGLTDKQLHRSDAVKTAAPMTVVRWAHFSCPSVPGGLNPATSLDEQLAS
jgi:hypothetical protein